MTITVAPTRNEYTATAAQAVFNYTFKIFTNTDLNVYVTLAGNDCDDSTDLTTAFSVAGVGLEDGGSITLNTPANAGDLITIVGDIPSSRTTDYQNNGDFIPDTVNDDLDRVVSLAKQVEDLSNRALLAQECQQNQSGLGLPKPLSLNFLRWKTDLSGMENVDLTSLGSPTNANVITYNQGGAGAVDRTVENKFQETISLRDNNPTGNGVTDDSVKLKQVHDNAVADGQRFAYVPPGTYNIPTATQISDIIWIGEGEFLGQLREKVHSSIRHGGDVLGDIIPKRHFRQFAQTDTAEIVIMGDSLATDIPTITHDEADSLWGILERRLIEDNPDVTFTFDNRGIGGATWTSANPSTNLADTGLTLPGWAGAGAQPWLDFVEALNPDILFFNFGMNDRQNFVTEQFRAIMNAVLGFTKVPDIVLITPLVPSRQSTNSSISDPIDQEGRDFVAGYLRTWAKFNGKAYIDVNRQYDISREGFDPTMSSLQRTSSTRRSVTTGFVALAGEECSDFGWDLSFTSIPAGFWDGLGAGNMRFFISPYAPDFPNSTSFVNIIDDAGFLQVELVDVDDVTGIYLTQTSAVPTPGTGASFTLTFFVKGDYLSIKLNDTDTIIYEGTVRRHGGQFLPKVEFTDGFTTGANAFFFQGSYLDHMPRLTDKEMWGSGDDGNTGGNNLNHPTSLGAATVYWPVLKNTDFRQPVAIEGNTEFRSTTERKVGMGTQFPQGVLHITKTPANASLPVSNANNFVIEDDTDPGMTFMSNNTGVARCNAGDEDDAGIGGWSYNHNDDTFSIKANNINVATFNDSIGTILTPLRFEAENNTGTVNTPNRSMTFDLTSNTNLRIRVRGNDGTVRTVDLTLA